jgi:hypothetical protein
MNSLKFTFNAATFFALITGTVAELKTPVRVSDIPGLALEDRRTLYLTQNPNKLADRNEFLAFLETGLRDSDVMIRRNAAGSAAGTLIAFQQMKQKGQPLPVDMSGLPLLQETLAVSMADTDIQVRGAAIEALAYSGEPTEITESIFLNRLAQEPSGELRGSILQAMTFAGYSSDRLKSMLITSFDDKDYKTREKAAQCAVTLRPAGGLPKLISLLEDQKMILDPVFDAIGAYGAAAGAYLPQLEKLLADPSNRATWGTAKEHLIAAIEKIKNPKPPASVESTVKALPLTEPPSPPMPSTLSPVVSASLSSVPSSPVEPSKPENPRSNSPVEGTSSNWLQTLLMISALAVAAVGAWRFLKR